MIQIKAFEAGSGESFYLYFPKEKFNILIDGGFSGTYENFKPTLQEIEKRREVLNLLIVTHMCRDHINGIIKLLKENGSNEESKIVEIKEIWFNTYFNSGKEKVGIDLPKDVANLLENYFPFSSDEGYIGDISSGDLIELGTLILNGGYIANTKPIQYETTPTIGRGNITFKILSPTEKILEELEKEFVEKIPKNIKEIKDLYKYELSKYYERFALSEDSQESPFIGDISIPTLEELANSPFEEDNRISNKSSIAFVIEYGGKKILFLGDSIPSVYIKSLEEHYSSLSNITFDLVKLSHHGSKNNSSLVFFEEINSERFLISTNGNNHNHPDEETISRLIIGHKKKTNILINCKNENLNKFIENDEWTKKYNYSIEENSYIEI